LLLPRRPCCMCVHSPGPFPPAFVFLPVTFTCMLAPLAVEPPMLAPLSVPPSPPCIVSPPTPTFTTWVPPVMKIPAPFATPVLPPWRLTAFAVTVCDPVRFWLLMKAHEPEVPPHPEVPVAVPPVSVIVPV